MGLNTTKLIEILDPQSGKIKETTIGEKPRYDAQDMKEVIAQKGAAMGIPGLGRMRLSEVAAVTTSEFPALLRDGLKPILFSSYNGVMQTWNQWAYTTSSDKPDEVYLEGSRIGLAPVVGEGDPYPTIDLALDRTIQIVNQKRGYILPITKEMVLFDRVQMINQMVTDLGEALATTKEQVAYNVLTTSGNYTRNSTTGDNDVGANQASTTFSAAGFITGYTTVTTMKDRKSGRYLGIQPNTLIVGPSLEFAAKQLFLGDTLWRTGGSTTPDVYGTTTENVFRGAIKNIVVSPFMVAGNWVVCQAQRAVVCQQVWGPELFQTTAVPENFNFMHYDVYEYRADEMYSFGMVNDRFGFLSTATATPVVN